MMNFSNLLDTNMASLAELITELQFKNNPGLLLKYGTAGKKKCCDDNIYHLSYLSVAMQIESTEVFTAYMLWAQKMLEARKIPVEDLSNNLDFIEIACKELLPAEVCEAVHIYIQECKEKLNSQSLASETYLKNSNPLLDDAKQYLDALLKGKRIKAHDLIATLVKNGVPVASIYENIFTVTQQEIGLLWQNNIITVAHEHYCTAATQSIMATLYPYIFTSEKKGRKMLACSVSGDLHEIGIRMLSDLFEMDGWDTYYMGANMPESNIISAIVEQNPQLLAISATMPFHITKVHSLIKKIRSNILLDNVRIMVGGYPFSLVGDLWRKVGADAFAPDANDAVKIANKMMLN